MSCIWPPICGANCKSGGSTEKFPCASHPINRPTLPLLSESSTPVNYTEWRSVTLCGSLITAPLVAYYILHKKEADVTEQLPDSTRVMDVDGAWRLPDNAGRCLAVLDNAWRRLVGPSCGDLCVSASKKKPFQLAMFLDSVGAKRLKPACPLCGPLLYPVSREIS